MSMMTMLAVRLNLTTGPRSIPTRTPLPDNGKKYNNLSTQDYFFASKLFVFDLYIVLRVIRRPINSQFTRACL